MKQETDIVGRLLILHSKQPTAEQKAVVMDASNEIKSLRQKLKIADEKITNMGWELNPDRMGR